MVTYTRHARVLRGPGIAWEALVLTPSGKLVPRRHACVFHFE